MPFVHLEMKVAAFWWLTSLSSKHCTVFTSHQDVGRRG